MWVAAVQLNSTAEIDANLARARAFIEEAAGRGARLVALPEHFAYLGPEAGLSEVAQPYSGPLGAGPGAGPGRRGDNLRPPGPRAPDAAAPGAPLPHPLPAEIIRFLVFSFWFSVKNQLSIW